MEYTTVRPKRRTTGLGWLDEVVWIWCSRVSLPGGVMPVDSWLQKVSMRDASVGDNASLQAFFNVRSNNYLVESGIA